MTDRHTDTDSLERNTNPTCLNLAVLSANFVTFQDPRMLSFGVKNLHSSGSTQKRKNQASRAKQVTSTQSNS